MALGHHMAAQILVITGSSNGLVAVQQQAINGTSKDWKEQT